MITTVILTITITIMMIMKVNFFTCMKIKKLLKWNKICSNKSNSYLLGRGDVQKAQNLSIKNKLQINK